MDGTRLTNIAHCVMYLTIGDNEKNVTCSWSWPMLKLLILQLYT